MIFEGEDWNNKVKIGLLAFIFNLFYPTLLKLKNLYTVK